MFYDGLVSCACATNGPCAANCTPNFCVHEAVAGSCSMCLQTSCGAAFMNCEAN
jgi:hypothetical protein